VLEIILYLVLVLRCPGSGHLLFSRLICQAHFLSLSPGSVLLCHPKEEKEQVCFLFSTKTSYIFFKESELNKKVRNSSNLSTSGLNQLKYINGSKVIKRFAFPIRLPLRNHENKITNYTLIKIEPHRHSSLATLI
jgi:hypothetical protein